LKYDLPKALMMNLSRRGFLRLAAGAVMLPKVAAGAPASYPTKPVHLLVGYAAGGLLTALPPKADIGTQLRFF